MSYPNVTVPMNTTTMETWMNRLGIYLNRQWGILAWELLGNALCILIAYLSIFSKKITGDYKWFVLNEVIANFLATVCMDIYIFISTVVIGVERYNLYKQQLCSGNSPSIWFSFFEVVFYGQLTQKIMRYAPQTTLLATAFNRWMAMAWPQRYSVFMSRRFIFLYCILCYLIYLLLCNVYDLLQSGLSETAKSLLDTLMSVIPWLIAAVLIAHICFILWKHRRTVSNSADKKRMQESRNVIVALVVQFIILLLTKLVPTVMHSLIDVMNTEGNCELANKINPEFSIIFVVTAPFLTPLYQCLPILIVMKPYREAILSAFHPILKIIKRCIKTDSNTVQVTPINLTQPVPIIVEPSLTDHK